jgi:hypothetical protein
MRRGIGFILFISSQSICDSYTALIMATSALQVFCYIITWTFFPLGISTGLIRVYCCRYVTKTWKPDDYMGIMSGAALVGMLAFWQVGLSLGCGG